MPERPPIPKPRIRRPEIPTREKAAMKTVLMARQSSELAVTRRSELPAEMAAALTRIADAAAKFATNEARACVNALLVALSSGAPEVARQRVERYVQRVGFLGEPNAAEQKALRFELAVAYRRMPRERQWQFDVIFWNLHRAYPKAWLSQPFVR